MFWQWSRYCTPIDTAPEYLGQAILVDCLDWPVSGDTGLAWCSIPTHVLSLEGAWKKIESERQREGKEWKEKRRISRKERCEWNIARNEAIQRATRRGANTAGCDEIAAVRVNLRPRRERIADESRPTSGRLWLRSRPLDEASTPAPACVTKSWPE